ncbi:MAG: DUF1844 domain-containing protein [Deltaproteobacteria bacterium]|nr:DUF1844 domain-containing protein [Deltaproteobacteria bacterium]
MVDEKKGYTFADKRGEPGADDSVVSDKPPGQPGRTGDVAGQNRELKIDFPTLIMSFASAAMISMGEVPDPATGRISKNLELARQNIDILALLQAKTRGNLSAEEENLIEGILYELRLGYIEAERGEK